MEDECCELREREKSYLKTGMTGNWLHTIVIDYKHYNVIANCLVIDYISIILDYMLKK